MFGKLPDWLIYRLRLLNEVQRSIIVELSALSSTGRTDKQISRDFNTAGIYYTL